MDPDCELPPIGVWVIWVVVSWGPQGRFRFCPPPRHRKKLFYRPEAAQTVTLKVLTLHICVLISLEAIRARAVFPLREWTFPLSIILGLEMELRPGLDAG